jgi:hypothetical protein
MYFVGEPIFLYVGLRLLQRPRLYIAGDGSVAPAGKAGRYGQMRVVGTDIRQRFSVDKRIYCV